MPSWGMKRPFDVKPIETRYESRFRPVPEFCAHCGKTATLDLFFDMEGIIKREKYCTACAERVRTGVPLVKLPFV